MAEAFRASQLSVAEFARSHGLHVERVRRWVGRVEGRRPKARPASKLKFAPVRLAQSQTEAGLEVAVGAGVVRVRRGFDQALLRQVVAALAGDAC